MVLQAASPSQRSIAVTLLPVSGSGSDENPLHFAQKEKQPEVSSGQWLVALPCEQGHGRRETGGGEKEVLCG